MKLYKTYRFKIKDPNHGKVVALRALAGGSWRRGLNYVLEMAKEMARKCKQKDKPFSAYDLHPWVYRTLRRLGLSADLACACRDKAFEAYKSHQELRQTDPGRRAFPHFEGTPALRLNIPRSCRLFKRQDQHWVEVSTPQGRIALPVAGRRAALERVWAAQPTHAEVVFRGKELFFHVGVSQRVPTPSAKTCRTFIGLDFNVFHHLIVAIARNEEGKVLGTFWVPAGRFNWKRKQFAWVRSVLQKAGALRKVKALKDREQRYVEAFLQEATTRLIRWASQFPSPFIAPEDLKGIRKKVKASRSLNRKLHSWPFGSGQAMVHYKGLGEGFFVKSLSGAFSSRYCSRCKGHNTRRSGASFACLGCGYGLNAHLNGAASMAWRAVCYTQVAAGRAESKPPSVNPAPMREIEVIHGPLNSPLGGHLVQSPASRSL